MRNAHKAELIEKRIDRQRTKLRRLRAERRVAVLREREAALLSAEKEEGSHAGN